VSQTQPKDEKNAYGLYCQRLLPSVLQMTVSTTAFTVEALRSAAIFPV
jgi:hypothetical protein